MARPKLLEPRTDTRFIVDGGYLSWIYGSSYDRLNTWTTDSRTKFSKAAGAIILLDSDRLSLRREFDKSYKERRVTRKTEDPVWIEKTRMVNEFKSEWIRPDPSLNTVLIEGLEADDLIALTVSAGILPAPVKVIGVDKDLLQLGDWDCFQMTRVTGERMTLSHFSAKFPKAAIPFIRDPRDVLLALTLMGDKSDSIERLIPPRRLDIFQEVMMNANPFRRAKILFGQDFLRNLYLAILPGPFCYACNPDPQGIYRRILAGYPLTQLYDRFNPDYIEQLSSRIIRRKRT